MTSTVSASIPDFRAPDDLTERDQWVLWRYEVRHGNRTKVPYQANGRRADSTNPGTWATFEEALGTWRRNRQRYAGLGFVFSKQDALAGVDLDDSLDEQGNVKAWACGIVERFSDTYSEISPSCTGLKIWARGSLPANLPGVQVGDGAVELYDHARYFAVTGRAFRGAPLEIEDHADDLLMLYDRLREAADFARTVGEVRRSDAARDIWHAVYPRLAGDRLGLFGAVTSRAEAQTMRLALVYALLDSSRSIEAEHLSAGLAVWSYCEASARLIFGDALGDVTADEVVRALRGAASGLTRTELSSRFGRNKSASEINRALMVLMQHGLVRSEKEDTTTGRPPERWFAESLGTKETNLTKELTGDGQ